MRGRSLYGTNRGSGTESYADRKSDILKNFGCALLLVMAAFSFAGCGTLKEAINIGKWKGIESTGSDEHYYLLKDIFMTAGSAAHPKDFFDHTMNESVNLVFTASNERNKYTAESRWIDPNDQEYRAISRTYDTKVEGREGAERKKGGTPRVHSMSTKELFDHKPGMWKVALYLDDKLARRLTFTVR